MSRFVTLSLAFESDLSVARRAYEDFVRDVEGRRIKVPFDFGSAGASTGAPAGSQTFSGTLAKMGGEYVAPPPIQPTPQSPGTPAATPASSGVNGETLAAGFASGGPAPTGGLAQVMAAFQNEANQAAQRGDADAVQRIMRNARNFGTPIQAPSSLGGARGGSAASDAGLSEPIKVTVDTSQAKSALAEVRQIATETRAVLANAIVPYGQMARRGASLSDDFIDAEWYPSSGASFGGGAMLPPGGGGSSMGAMNNAHINRWRMSQLPESSGARDFSAPTRNPFGFLNRSFMSNRAAFLAIAGTREVMGAMSAVSRASQAQATGESLEDQFAAEMQEIDRIQSGMLGPIAGFAVDPNGSRRASAEATVRAGQATNSGSEAMRTWGEYRLRLSEEAQVSQTPRFGDPNRELRMIDVESSRMRRQAIQERNVRMESAIAQIRTSAAAEVSQMDSHDPRILANLQSGDLFSLSTRMAAAREATINQMTQQQSTAMFGTLNTQMEGAIASINAIQNDKTQQTQLEFATTQLGYVASGIRNQGALDAANYALHGQPVMGQLAASFANQRATQLFNTPFSAAWWKTAYSGALERDTIGRDDIRGRMQIQSDTSVANLLANNDVYGAGQKRLSDDFAMNTLGMDQSSQLYKDLQGRFQSQAHAQEMQRTDQLNLMNLGLFNEGAGLEKHLSRDYAGERLETLAAGFDERQASLQAPDEQDARIKTLQNERLAVKGFAQDYWDSFHGEALDLRRFDVTNPRDQEHPEQFNRNVEQLLDSIDQTLKNLGVDAN